MRFIQDSSAIAAALIENGYMPVPIPLGQKGSRIPNWPARAFTAVDFPGSCNIGIRCGDAGVALLDVDIYDADVVCLIVSEWLERFGKRGTQMQRTGAAPKTAIPFRTDAGAKTTHQVIRPTGKAPLTANGTPKTEQVEVHSTRRQFVAYGIHPDTQQPYHWHGLHPAEAVSGHVETLPLVSANEVAEFLSWVRATFGPAQPACFLPEKNTASQAHLDANFSGNRGNKVIAAFNRAHRLTDLLRQYGYIHRYGAHWKSPNSTTGSAAVEVLGERWRSQSGSDAALGLGAESKGGIRTGDAFDLYVFYEHGGDFSCALRSYAETAGLNQRLVAPPINPVVPPKVEGQS